MGNKRNRNRQSNRHAKWEERRRQADSPSSCEKETGNIQNPLTSALCHLFSKEGLNLSTVASEIGIRAGDLRKAKKYYIEGQRGNGRRLTTHQSDLVMHIAGREGWIHPEA